MNAYHKFRALPLIAASVSLLGSGVANALTIGFDDGLGNVVTIQDGGTGDTNATVGIVSYVGVVGNWTLNLTSGINHIGSGLNPPYLDLFSFNGFNSTGGTLIVSVWDTYTNLPANAVTGGILGSIGGTTIGTVSAVFSQYNEGEAPSGSTISSASLSGFESGPFGGGAVLTDGSSGAAAFDLGIDVTITHAGSGNTSFDAELRPVPIPMAAWLFGSALFGTIALGRRKLARNQVPPA